MLPPTPAVLTCGTSRVKSVKSREMVGMRVITESLMTALAPVRPGEMTAPSSSAVTVSASSATAWAARVKFTSWVVPSASDTSARCWAAYPSPLTCTR